MKKVLLVTEATVYRGESGLMIAKGGGEVCFHNIAKSFIKLGFEVTVFSIREFEGQVDFEVIDGVNYERFPVFSRTSFRIFSYLKKALRKSSEYDLIVLNQFSPHLILPWLKTKNIAVIHDVYVPLGIRFWIKQYGFFSGVIGSFVERLQLKFDCKYADKVMTVSDFSEEKILALFGERIHGRLFKNPFPIDVSKYYFEELKEDYILFVGRFVEYKHPEHVLYVLKKIKEFFPTLKAVFVASRIDKNVQMNFFEVQRKLGLSEDDVELVLDASEEELRRLFAGAKLFIQPSFVEGQGIVVLEALASNTPVVAYDLPAYKGMLINGINSLLVSQGNVDALANSALYILRSYSKYFENCHSSLGGFSEEKFCEKLKKSLPI